VGILPNKLIKDLIDKGAVTLKEQGYSIRSREYTLLTWKQFQEFCNKKGYETYLPSHKDEFITELGKCTPPLRQSTIDRKAGSMKMLDLLATKGTWGKGMLNPLQELLPEFNSFLDAQEEYARSSLTMKQKALERVSDSPVPSMPSWQKSRSTMEWLKSFGSQKA
jgi:integrase/recombinase XerD